MPKVVELTSGGLVHEPGGLYPKSTCISLAPKTGGGGRGLNINLFSFRLRVLFLAIFFFFIQEMSVLASEEIYLLVEGGGSSVAFVFKEHLDFPSGSDSRLLWGLGQCI